MPAWLRYAPWRVSCRRCRGVKVEQVPWASGSSVFTSGFEELAAYLAQVTDRTAVSRLLGISWVTVGSIVERVVARRLDGARFAKLRQIGIDEFSYRKRHRYLTIVVDHDERRVVWAGRGRSAETLGAFFEQLGPGGCARIELVTADLASSWQKALRAWVPHARVVFDRFHVERLAADAVDEVRRGPARMRPARGSTVSTLRRRAGDEASPCSLERQPAGRPKAAAAGGPGSRGGGRRVRHGVRTSLDVLGMTENQALRIENGYHLVPVSPCDHEAGGPWTNPELQRPPRRRRMASTRPPGTYSPSARTGRRGGGSGSVDGMVRRADSDALSMSLRSTAPVGSSAASIRRRNRPNTAFRFRDCFDMRNPLQHNPGPRGPGRTDGDRGRRGRRRRDPGGRRRLRGAH